MEIEREFQIIKSTVDEEKQNRNKHFITDFVFIKYTLP